MTTGLSRRTRRLMAVVWACVVVGGTVAYLVLGRVPNAVAVAVVGSLSAALVAYPEQTWRGGVRRRR